MVAEAVLNWDQLYFPNKSVSIESHINIGVAPEQEKKMLRHMLHAKK